MRMCSVDGCDRPVYARGWCHAHYTRWRKYGDVTYDGRKARARSEADRFWEKVDKSTDCWIWTGKKGPSGYGSFWGSDGRDIRAHRWTYESVHGAIPGELQIDHRCRNRACVRPDHLEAVTPQINTHRSAAPTAVNVTKKRCPQGHLYDEINTYRVPISKSAPHGGRACRICRRAAARKSYAKRKQG